jgi:hypothetical protein
MSTKMMSMLLTLLFTCLAFFGLGEFGPFMYGSNFLPRNACLIFVRVSVALFPRFAQNIKQYLSQTHREIALGQMHDSQIKGHKKSARPPSNVKFCTLTPKICYYYHVSLLPITTTAVQMAVPGPEIVNNPVVSCFTIF